MVKNAMKLKKCEKNTEKPESHNEEINSTEIEAVCVRGWRSSLKKSPQMNKFTNTTRIIRI